MQKCFLAPFSTTMGGGKSDITPNFVARTDNVSHVRARARRCKDCRFGSSPLPRISIELRLRALARSRADLGAGDIRISLELLFICFGLGTSSLPHFRLCEPLLIFPTMPPKSYDRPLKSNPLLRGCSSSSSPLNSLVEAPLIHRQATSASPPRFQAGLRKQQSPAHLSGSSFHDLRVRWLLQVFFFLLLLFFFFFYFFF